MTEEFKNAYEKYNPDNGKYALHKLFTTDIITLDGKVVICKKEDDDTYWHPMHPSSFAGFTYDKYLITGEYFIKYLDEGDVFLEAL